MGSPDMKSMQTVTSNCHPASDCRYLMKHAGVPHVEEGELSGQDWVARSLGLLARAGHACGSALMTFRLWERDCLSWATVSLWPGDRVTGFK